MSETNPEYSGCWVAANQWYRIGVPQRQAGLLKLAAKRLLASPKSHTSAKAAHVLLMVALAHLDDLHELWSQDYDYATAEGLCIESYLQRRAEDLLMKGLDVEALIGPTTAPHVTRKN